MTQQHDLLRWYEANLPPHERKMRGHFSTPPRLVEQILDACGYTPDRDLSQIRVLDPACGSGNFLTGATQRLLTWGQHNNLSATRQARNLERNLWGFDPDPIACTLAELQMRTAFTERYPKSKALQRLHIHQADGLAFRWENHANVDLFLANPPYLAAKNNDLSGYRTTHQRGQLDSYLLFLSLGLQIVRPHGWIGLVLPDPVLARANAMRERQRLLEETTIHHIWHLADVFAAYVGAVVIVAQKTPPHQQHHIFWERARWSERQTIQAEVAKNMPAMVSRTVSQHLLRNQPGTELRYLLSTIEGTLLERLHRQYCSHISGKLVYLGECVFIRRGEELGKDSSFLRTQPPESTEQTWYPLLRGGIDIRPYGIPVAKYWIERQHIIKPLERYLTPKLLLVKSAGQLKATLDLQGYVVLQTLYVLHLNQSNLNQQQTEKHKFSLEDELYFLLALLNSRLLQEYIYVLYTAYKWVQPQIEQHVLAQLPIPIHAPTIEKRQIIQRARQMMQACSPSTAVVELDVQRYELYEEQERAISSLYEGALQERPGMHGAYPDIDEGVSLYG
ncbi:N-6 DNA methylase [Dictyobacter arantiisoli]|uniref:site-specific DNA-methyltransferase (adenine-specific) n=1 Tax=Dictyobacter arantiisoli TaxID=2014874 RepID=A0A5A5T5G7_9CHLR|nr:N-6 DNA methylase [Dictyobacter arantiisoli]GCF06592.1 hypothetical protein KDI_01560 [Dictyobacter arantiisoli]